MNKIQTSEDDTGLWSVYRGGRCLGYIWEPQKGERIEARIFADVYGTPNTFVQDDPRFVALDDWVDGIMPGNPIEGCATWHAALHAVVDYDRHLSEREAIIRERRALFGEVIS